MIFEHLGFVFGTLLVIIVLQLGGMVVMSERMKRRGFPVPTKQWNWFRRLTWSTVGMSVLLIITSLVVIGRH